jgi:hypothetical protein
MNASTWRPLLSLTFDSSRHFCRCVNIVWASPWSTVNVLTRLQVDIVRTFEQTTAFINELQPGDSNTVGTEQNELCIAALETSFRNVIAAHKELSEEPWNCAPFVTFLDGAPLPGALTSTTVTLMKNKVSYVFTRTGLL